MDQKQRASSADTFNTAEEAIKAAPHDAAAKAKYVEAKNAFDEHGVGEEKALKELGWDGKTYQADISLNETTGTKVGV